MYPDQADVFLSTPRHLIAQYRLLSLATAVTHWIHLDLVEKLFALISQGVEVTGEGPCHDPGLGQHLRETRKSDCHRSTDIGLAQNARIVNIDRGLPRDIQIHTRGAIILG